MPLGRRIGLAAIERPLCASRTLPRWADRVNCPLGRRSRAHDQATTMCGYVTSEPQTSALLRGVPALQGGRAGVGKSWVFRRVSARLRGRGRAKYEEFVLIDPAHTNHVGRKIMPRLPGWEVCVTALLLCSAQAWAQEFPSKPVTIIVGVAPGGTLDTLARQIASGLGPHLKQTAIIENVTGAGGLVGFQRLTKSEPDGHTLMFSNPSMELIPLLYPSANI